MRERSIGGIVHYARTFGKPTFYKNISASSVVIVVLVLGGGVFFFLSALKNLHIL